MRTIAQSSKFNTPDSKFAVAFVWSLVIGLWSGANAQMSATLHADSNQIQIGDFLNIRLNVTHPSNALVAFPVIGDTLGSLEVISASKIDTAISANQKTLSQLFTVSAYDSGLYHAGPVKIYVQQREDKLDSFSSNKLLVAVSTLAVDTTLPFKPIKAPLDVPYSWLEFIYYIIAAIMLLIAIVLAIIFLKMNKKSQPVVIERPKPKQPPHTWVREELKKLEEEKLWQSDQTKLYYSRLTDILRLYLEYRYNWQALESTTEEIEQEVKKYNLKEKAKENLLSILRTADLVKFAKMLPIPEANIKAMESAYKFIDFTEPDPQAAPKSTKGA